MTKEAANEIGPLFQNTEVPTELVIEGDKARLVLKEDVGPRKAGSDYSKTVTLSTEPEVGLQPVEIMNTSNDDSRNIHFGNEITEVSTVDATQAITKKMDADNAAPAIKKEDVAAVVEVAKSPDDIIAEQRQKSLIADLVLSGCGRTREDESALLYLSSMQGTRECKPRTRPSLGRRFK